ncbi:MAG: type II toxin-antitoxin system RelE/ParE family toxin [Actinobacteria bacterium]|nr:type II toxin-antitoxin system RelE/ParE family toxin [Actinomycetota bacterium]
MLDSPEWTLKMTKQALSQLSSFDKPVAQRILKKLQWLSRSQNPISLLKPLKENRSGQYSLRIQELRAIIEVSKEERTILVLELGHRGNVYD